MIAFQHGAALVLLLACIDARAIQKPFSTLEVGMFSGVLPSVYPAGTAETILPGTAPIGSGDIGPLAPTDGGVPVSSVNTPIDSPALPTATPPVYPGFPAPSPQANPNAPAQSPAAVPNALAQSLPTDSNAPAQTPPAELNVPSSITANAQAQIPYPTDAVNPTPPGNLLPSGPTDAPLAATPPYGAGNASSPEVPMPSDAILPQSTDPGLGQQPHNSAPAGVFISVPFQTVTVTITAAPVTITAPAACAASPPAISPNSIGPAGVYGPGTGAGGIAPTDQGIPTPTSGLDGYNGVMGTGTALSPQTTDMGAPFANSTDPNGVAPMASPIGTGTTPDTPLVSPKQTPGMSGLGQLPGSPEPQQSPGSPGSEQSSGSPESQPSQPVPGAQPESTPIGPAGSLASSESQPTPTPPPGDVPLGGVTGGTPVTPETPPTPTPPSGETPPNNATGGPSDTQPTPSSQAGGALTDGAGSRPGPSSNAQPAPTSSPGEIPPNNAAGGPQGLPPTPTSGSGEGPPNGSGGPSSPQSTESPAPGGEIPPNGSGGLSDNQPTPTGQGPAGTSTDPAATPTDPAATPTDPAATPTDPVSPSMGTGMPSYPTISGMPGPYSNGTEQSGAPAPTGGLPILTTESAYVTVTTKELEPVSTLKID